MNKKITFLLFLIVMVAGNAVFAQTSSEPTLKETIEWLRSKLIAYGKDKYGNSVKDVEFDTASKQLIVYYDIVDDNSAPFKETSNIAALNANSLAWEVVRLPKSYLSLTIPSTTGNAGSTVFFKENRTKNDKGSNRSYTKFCFSTSTFGNEENLQERFSKAMITLIKLCGGYVATEKF